MTREEEIHKAAKEFAFSDKTETSDFFDKMDKKLAIKGHPTRGKEVIEILEMLGGVNKYQIGAIRQTYVYFIDIDNIIRLLQINQLLPEKDIVYSLEEFLEIFPYKVGDKVRVWSQHDDEFFYGSYSCDSKTIKSMQWNEIRGKVAYTIEGIDRVFYKEELIPYKEEVNMKDNKVDLTLKEETMEDKDMSEHTSEINLNHPCFDGCDKIELIIPENWKFEQKGNKMFGVRKYPQYPKTYDECLKILGYNIAHIIPMNHGHNGLLMMKLQRLLIFRDAYWKIADKEMGLDKPWKPDWTIYKHKFCLGTDKDKVIEECVTTGNRILAFPTKEMRDAFYENFKELINEVKELL